MYLVKMVYKCEPEVFFYRRSTKGETLREFLSKTVHNARERKFLLAYQVFKDNELIEERRFK